MRPDSWHPEVAIWGLGLIGFTLACELAAAGRRCVLMDVDPARVHRLNSGRLPFGHAAKLGERHRAAAASGLLRATTKPDEVLTPAHPVQVLCIPTEADGAIDDGPLREVMRTIAVAEGAARPLHVVIESTVAPAWIDGVAHAALREAGWVHGVDYHLGASPRRDWLTTREHTLATVPKVIGGDTEEAVEAMRELYEPICDRVVLAADAKQAAVVKVVENVFRYRAILLANELATAFPEHDVAAVLRLAATKWNVEEYHPSLGIGGYCVPLAKDYLGTGGGAGAAEWLAGLEEAEAQAQERAQDAALRHAPFEHVALLGLAYAGDLRVATRSPAVAFAQRLHDRGCASLAAHDPCFSAEEITGLVGAEPVGFPHGLRGRDTVMLFADHECYRTVDHDVLLASLDDGTCIIDNLGTWADRWFPERVRYVEVGGATFSSMGAAAELQRP
jgi:nucleotide sugar dehydrogenase